MDTRILKAMQADPAEFRRHLLIDADTGPVRLGDVMDDWQREDFAALDPACRRVVGQDVTVKHQRAWLERPRGHSKSADIATCTTWMMFASPRKLSAVVAAADRDQAKLIRDAVDRLVRMNRWLAKYISIQQYSVKNTLTGSELRVLSSDSFTSFGLTSDVICLDELTHHKSSDLWESLFSAAAKRANCLLLVICNAGWRDSWQWPIREAVRNDPDWYFRRLDGPVASWMDEAKLAEQERLLPPKAFKRLWLNVWSDGAGDALSAEMIEGAITLRGPVLQREDNHAYVAGLDLGVKQDHSALCILGCHGPTGRVHLAHLDHWAPPKGGEIDLMAVEQAVIAAHQRFNLAKVVYDPWQAELMAARLKRRGIRCEPMHFVGQNLNLMATSLLSAFQSNNIELYRHDRLIRDLKRLVIVEKSYGFRLEATRDSSGHADTATALAIALPHATRRALAGCWGASPQAILVPTHVPRSMGRFQPNENRFMR
jgi:phage terminase large subunit-like protein